jgi:integrase
MPKKAPGPNGEKLPPDLYWDGRSFRIRVAPGVPRERAGTHKGKALALLKRRRREIRSGAPSANAPQRPNTLNALAKSWYQSQDADSVPSLRAAYRQYQLHIAPQLGKLPPDDVRPVQVLDVLVSGTYETAGLAAASVHNLCGTLSAIYEHGRFRELCDENPCTRIPRGKLPSKRKQHRPCYSDAEAVQLFTDDRIPEPFRVFYALAGLARLRMGEVAGLRWKDYDRDALGLGSLFVHVQYNDRRLKTAKGDDTKERMVPVHLVLASILAAWKLGGFARAYGRPPTAEDRIVPDARNMQALTVGIVSKRAPKDCAVIGIPNKGMHGLRRFFITYARAGGARPDVLERITHNAKGTILDTYTDAEGLWSALCETVQCLRVTLPASSRTQLRTQA